VTYSEERTAQSPPFLKGDLGGLSGAYIITPDPPLEKGGIKPPLPWLKTLFITLLFSPGPEKGAK
jgi:hypothetical protein